MEFSETAAYSFISELATLRKQKPLLDYELLHLADQLKSERAQVFLKQGAVRRLGTIHHCAKKIFSVFPPNRVNLLSQDELSEVAVYYQAFVINVYGILDNIAWVCALEGNLPEPDKNKMSIGLFKFGIRDYLPESLLTYLDSGPSKDWFEKYAKIYRDSTTHRIPPYIPPSSVVPKNAQRLNDLEEEKLHALNKLYNADLYQQLIEQQNSLLNITGLVALSLSGIEKEEPLIQMHPQVINDLMTIHELFKYFSIGMNETYSLTKLTIPDMDFIW